MPLATCRERVPVRFENIHTALRDRGVKGRPLETVRSSLRYQKAGIRACRATGRADHRFHAFPCTHTVAVCGIAGLNSIWGNPLPAYRCGGSAGFSPASRLTR